MAALKHWPEHDQAELRRLRTEGGLSVYALGERFGTGRNAIINQLLRMSLPVGWKFRRMLAVQRRHVANDQGAR